MDKSFEHDIEILDSVRKKIEEEGESHFLSNIDTPIVDNAFDLSDDEKIDKIEKHFREIMKILGLDLNDDSLKGTPYRVAKMYVNEMFSGLNPKNKPSVSLFENKYDYHDMIVEKNITFYSNCEHHFVPIIGKAHIGYISSGNVIGLSKMHRIVNYYAKRPQVQERMTVQVINELKSALQTEDIGLIIDADHLCVSSRGIKDITSSTITVESGGKFREDKHWNKFLSLINTGNVEK
jgi:GTP cyclohydrolase I|tara:strand:- start:26529 stop:27236 length:708 start_codon:yes stop_codon:yes gene_type:complete